MGSYSANGEGSIIFFFFFQHCFTFTESKTPLWRKNALLHITLNRLAFLSSSTPLFQGQEITVANINVCQLHAHMHVQQKACPSKTYLCAEPTEKECLKVALQHARTGNQLMGRTRFDPKQSISVTQPQVLHLMRLTAILKTYPFFLLLGTSASTRGSLVILALGLRTKAHHSMNKKNE